MKEINTTVKGKNIFLLASPVILVWAILLYLSATSSVLHMAGKKFFYFNAFSDKVSGGNSDAGTRLSGDTLIFAYQLRKGYTWPYAGLYFTFPNDSANNELGEQNYFHIHLKARRAKTLPLIINEYVPGYSDTANNRKYRSWKYILKILPGKDEYKIAFSDFKTPPELDTIHEKYHYFNPKEIKSLTIQNCMFIKTNESDEIRIISLTIEKDYAGWIWWAFIFTTGWILGIVLFIVLKQKKTSVFIPYLATGARSYPENEWGEIQKFISCHYMNELDMDILEKELGIARHKIASLIKGNTSLLFKQYLNQIRIAEARRLLITTNIPIGEIAEKTGFGHISNFNRVFKEYTGQSPSYLRKKKEDKPS